MNTAKNFQLLDDNNNNISPITNIESLYYEVNEGGIIYRNALYQHFPIYVKYNNNIDAPIDANSLRAYIDNNIYQTTDSSFYKSPNVQLKEQNSPSTPGADILVTAIRQSRLANTRYHKLDISTYNLTSILNLYAPKQYVVDSIQVLTEKTNHVKYNSNIIKENANGQFKTLYDLGSYPKGTSITELNNKDLNDIIDQAFFKEVGPDIIDTNISMINPKPIYIDINPTTISKLKDKPKWKEYIYNTIKTFINESYNYRNNAPKFLLVHKLLNQNDAISTNNYFNVQFDLEDSKFKHDILEGDLVDKIFSNDHFEQVLPLKITANSNWLDSNLTPYVKTNWGKQVSKEIAYNIIKNTPITISKPYIDNTKSEGYIFKDENIYMSLPPVTDLITTYNNILYLEWVFKKTYAIEYIEYPRNGVNDTQIFNDNIMTKEVFDNLWNNYQNTNKINIINNDLLDVTINYNSTNNILALILPNPKNITNNELKESVKITHIISNNLEIPITENNQFYKWTKVIDVQDMDYKILILDTMLSGNNKFIIHIDQQILM